MTVSTWWTTEGPEIRLYLNEVNLNADWCDL